MAAASKRALKRDYSQLDSFSSVVMYDTVPNKRKETKLYEVERVLTRRRIRHDYEYLIKWRGWALEFCSWEPSTNLTQDLLSNYNKPPITEERLQSACRQFCSGVTATIRSPSSSSLYVHVDLDIWRYVSFGKGMPSQHRGHFLFEKNDLNRFKYLPENWWYQLNDDGQGTAVKFPIKIKPIVSWSPSCNMSKDGKLLKAPRFPLEKLCVTIIRRACNINNL